MALGHNNILAKLSIDKTVCIEYQMVIQDTKTWNKLFERHRLARSIVIVAL